MYSNANFLDARNIFGRLFNAQAVNLVPLMVESPTGFREWL
jgi:hypothetical protein